MTLTFSKLAAALLALSGCMAAVAGQTSPVSPAAPALLASTPAQDAEAAAIRHHHLKRLSERLTAEPAALEAKCRYESEISTPPPLNRVALTFDDGPTAPGTDYILAVLKKYDIHATFFMIGDKARQNPELVERVRAAGHQVIANHSWSHPNFHDISPAEQAGEVLRNDGLPDKDGLKLFRYPYGNSTCETNDLVHAHGYKIVGWHIDSCDWAYDKTGAVDAREAISCGVPRQFQSDYVGHVIAAARARRGGIILMHEIHPNTLARLDTIIAGLLAEGFSFGSVTDPEFQPSLR